ncbi:hypothetical protein F4821DRAFT_227219 [Hypoxylon rubiginosum]|uniref:Uncharacterized protein n=1 Tax=Hypoxylon rubiginosum TaxID=110542 RepID=A0ACC0DE80_9PEZI|nr:hypothetical protein F4821DRAFT_227219 [Hypoxylon rubiginosum]
MPSIGSLAAVAMLLVSGAHAHFQVQHPDVIQPFVDDSEPDAPCGGYTPDPAKLNATDFHVDGDWLSTRQTHPYSNWLYRITTDLTAAGNWTEIYPIFRQTGQGEFCIPKVTVPQNFTGQTAILGFVSDAPDGLLYQCAAVRFVEGSVEAPAECKNASGVTADYISDSNLSPLVNNPSEEKATSFGVSARSDTFRGLGAMFTVGVMVMVGAFMVV